MTRTANTVGNNKGGQNSWTLVGVFKTCKYDEASKCVRVGTTASPVLQSRGILTAELPDLVDRSIDRSTGIIALVKRTRTALHSIERSVVCRAYGSVSLPTNSWCFHDRATMFWEGTDT